jgi:hypothetical protein
MIYSNPMELIGIKNQISNPTSILNSKSTMELF